MEQQKYETAGVIWDIPEKEQHGQLHIQKLVLMVPGYNGKEEYVQFEFKGKNADKPSGFHRDQLVKVCWELQGRENNGRVWNCLSAWKITSMDGAQRQGGDRFSRPKEESGGRYSRDYKINDREPNGRMSDRERMNNPGKSAAYSGNQDTEIDF